MASKEELMAAVDSAKADAAAVATPDEASLVGHIHAALDTAIEAIKKLGHHDDPDPASDTEPFGHLPEPEEPPAT